MTEYDIKCIKAYIFSATHEQNIKTCKQRCGGNYVNYIKLITDKYRINLINCECDECTHNYDAMSHITRGFYIVQRGFSLEDKITLALMDIKVG